MDTLIAVRPARLVTPALLIICSLLAVTGCGAGQDAQTARHVITQEGANSMRGGISLLTVLVPTPAVGTYPAGGQAPLNLAISAEETHTDTLVGVTTDAAASVSLVGSPFVLPPTGTSASPSGGASPSAAASPSPAGSVSPSASASPSPSGAASPSASASPGSEGLRLEVGKGALLKLAQGAGYLELRGLTRELRPGDTITVTFSFEHAGDITLDVPVATPDTPGPRPSPSEGHAEE